MEKLRKWTSRIFYVLVVMVILCIPTIEAKAYTNADVSNPVVRRMGKQLGWSDAYIKREGGYITYQITGINDSRKVYTSNDGYGYGSTANNNRLRKPLSGLICKQHMNREGSRGNHCYILTYSDAPTCTTGGWIWVGCSEDSYSFMYYHTYKEQLVPDEAHRIDLTSHYGYYQDALGHDYNYGTWTYGTSNGIKNGMRYHKCNYCSAYTDLQYFCGVTAGTGIASVTGEGWYSDGSKVTLTAEIKPGYTWNKWIWTGNGSSTDAIFSFTIQSAYEFTALADANPYMIHFDANGGAGDMADIACMYDVPIVLPKNVFTRNNGYGDSTFLGWNVISDAREALYLDGEEVVNITDIRNKRVILYAIWDDCPWIEVEDMYYSLKDAQNGLITQEELLSHARAYDRECGDSIKYGIDEENSTSFRIIDYNPMNFTTLVSNAEIIQTFEVIDFVGNVYRKAIVVHIVDTESKIQLPIGTTRFIDEKYYHEVYERGGLEENSVWKMDPEYMNLLERAFQNARNNTPIRSYHLTYEDILQMK